LAAVGQAQVQAGAAAPQQGQAQLPNGPAAGAGATPCRSCGQLWRPAGGTVISCLQQRHQMGHNKLS
jgi:hypothetical protein